MLVDGSNQIQISASNGCGTEVVNMNINYEACKSPIIKFIAPSHTNFQVAVANYKVKATVALQRSINWSVLQHPQTLFHE